MKFKGKIMYPYDIIFGMGLYEILICVGIIAAMLIFRHFSDKKNISAKLHNFILFNTVVTVVGGYGSAVAVQSFYNYLAGDRLEITRNTGATFLGGLVGGAALFIAVYFGAGHFWFRKNGGEHIQQFDFVADVAAVCIPIAHGFGRLGCLMAGCCYGKVCDEARWFTVKFLRLNADDEVIGHRYAVPVQLYEAVFLFLIGIWLWYCMKRGKKGIMPRYMIAYGVWRFIAEYFRDDDRGNTLVSFMTPSQLTSVFLVLGGIVLAIILLHNKKTKTNNTHNDEE